MENLLISGTLAAVLAMAWLFRMHQIANTDQSTIRKYPDIANGQVLLTSVCFTIFMITFIVIVPDFMTSLM